MQFLTVIEKLHTLKLSSPTAERVAVHEVQNESKIQLRKML